jgi:hypothetical protein
MCRRHDKSRRPAAERDGRAGRALRQRVTEMHHYLDYVDVSILTATEPVGRAAAAPLPSPTLRP